MILMASPVSIRLGSAGFYHSGFWSLEPIFESYVTALYWERLFYRFC